jgi:hypothetical protein
VQFVDSSPRLLQDGAVNHRPDIGAWPRRKLIEWGFAPSRFVSACLTAVCFSALGAARAEPPPSDSKVVADIRVWIRELDSAEFAKREQAERNLLQSELAPAFLKQAIAENASPELRRRAAQVLDRRRLQMRDDVVRLIDALYQRGEFARATAIAYEWRYVLREKLRDAQINAAKTLVDVVNKKTGRRFALPKIPEKLQLALDRYRFERIPGGDTETPPILFAGTDAWCSSRGYESIFLYSGAPKYQPDFESSLVFVSGGTARLSGVARCIVFVDGDARLDPLESIVVCTGNVECPSGVRDSVVIARGKIDNHGRAKEKGADLRAQEKELVELVRPWSASELGVRTSVHSGEMVVVHVDPHLPMGRAGVLAGDILISLDGSKPGSNEEATRQLCHSAAGLLPFIVRVKRGDRDAELIVQQGIN